VIQKVVDVDHSTAPCGMLFKMEARTLQEQRDARRETIKSRCDIAVNIANEIDGPVLIWCDLNAEGDLLESLIEDSIQNLIDKFQNTMDGINTVRFL
jgi:hypothetical protein